MGTLDTIRVFIWDFGLVILNLVTYPFRHKVGAVIPKGLPGHDGIWPEFVPPRGGDSRCSCPALNAMANHGILPHNGRNIPLRELGDLVNKTYNFAPSFCYFVSKYIGDVLTRDYDKDTIDLSDIDVHNGIEHDASLFRHDAIFEPDQSKIAFDLVDEFLSSVSGTDNTVTVKDMSAALTKRRLDSRSRNNQYTLGKQHKFFGSANASTLLTIFGGRLDDITVLLKEERLPEGWEPRILDRYGLTMATFNRTVKKVENGIDVKKVKKLSDEARAARVSVGGSRNDEKA